MKLKLNEEINGLKLIQVNNGFVVVDLKSKILNGDWCIHPTTLNISQQSFDNNLRIYWNRIIFATPNLNLEGVPVIEEKELPFDKLCYYDRRYSDFSIKEEYGYDKEEVEATGDFSKKDCACDNCFYGRSKLANQIIEQAQQNLFTRAEMKLAFLENDKNRSFEEFIQSLKQPTVEITFENNTPVKAIML